jgi:hypothetical protein
MTPYLPVTVTSKDASSNSNIIISIHFDVLATTKSPFFVCTNAQTEAAANTPQKVLKHTAASLRRRNELRKLELRTLAAKRNFRRRMEER